MLNFRSSRQSTIEPTFNVLLTLYYCFDKTYLIKIKTNSIVSLLMFYLNSYFCIATVKITAQKFNS